MKSAWITKSGEAYILFLTDEFPPERNTPGCKMHILFLSDNFPPETNAPASRLYEHATHWVYLGHQVTVITGAPNFPQGKVYPGYWNRWYAVEHMNGIRVVRVKTYIAPNEGFSKRILDYLSFMATSVTAGLFQKDPDIIVATSPQFFAAAGGWLLAAWRRRPFLFELRDLWPAQIVTVGMMPPDSRVVRWLEKLELFLYRQAAAIIPVTESFKLDLVARGIPESKISVVINGVDLNLFAQRPRDQALSEELGLADKFVVGYLGTHGLNQGLEQGLDAARLLQDQKQIVFLFVGDGARRNALIQIADSMNLANVKFMASQPKEMMPRLWSLCDVTLIPLKNDPLYTKMIPSKLFEVMGMGVPAIVALPEGEATRIVRKYGTGIVVPPEQPARLAAVILELYNTPDEVAALRQASAAAAPFFSRTSQAEKMLKVFQAVVEDTPGLARASA